MLAQQDLDKELLSNQEGVISLKPPPPISNLMGCTLQSESKTSKQSVLAKKGVTDTGTSKSKGQPLAPNSKQDATFSVYASNYTKRLKQRTAQKPTSKPKSRGKSRKTDSSPASRSPPAQHKPPRKARETDRNSVDNFKSKGGKFYVTQSPHSSLKMEAQKDQLKIFTHSLSGEPQLA